MTGLPGLLAVLVRSDLPKDAELLVLRHENQVLCRQLAGRLRGAMRTGSGLRLVAADEPPPVAEVFPVTPATILRWHRDIIARK